VKSKLNSDKLSDAMSKFDAYERKIDNLEAEVESYDLGKKSLADEFADLAADDKVSSELEALKAKVKKSAAKASKE
jgi:phage shock protein A